MTDPGRLAAEYAAYFAAVRARDAAFLEAKLDPRFFSTDPAGVRRDKQAYIAYCLGLEVDGLEIEVDELRVHAYGGLCVTEALWRLSPHPLAGAAGVLELRQLGVWADGADGLVYLAQQGTVVVAATKI